MQLYNKKTEVKSASTGDSNKNGTKNKNGEETSGKKAVSAGAWGGLAHRTSLQAV